MTLVIVEYCCKSYSRRPEATYLVIFNSHSDMQELLEVKNLQSFNTSFKKLLELKIFKLEVKVFIVIKD